MRRRKTPLMASVNDTDLPNPASVFPTDDERYHHPRTSAELTDRNIRTVARLEAASDAERTVTDRVVDAVTTFCGSMTFIWVHVFWFGGWLLMNLLPHASRELHFDPYPFQLLTLVVSLEAILLSTFILISQNRQSKIADRRNNLDLQINLLAEQESTKTLYLLSAIAAKLGVVSDDDPEIAILEEATRPDYLVEQIERVIERKEREDGKGHHGLSGSKG